jgi:hypothetical protein
VKAEVAGVKADLADFKKSVDERFANVPTHADLARLFARIPTHEDVAHMINSAMEQQRAWFCALDDRHAARVDAVRAELDAHRADRSVHRATRRR